MVAELTTGITVAGTERKTTSSVVVNSNNSSRPRRWLQLADGAIASSSSSVGHHQGRAAKLLTFDEKKGLLRRRSRAYDYQLPAVKLGRESSYCWQKINGNNNNHRHHQVKAQVECHLLPSVVSNKNNELEIKNNNNSSTSSVDNNNKLCADDREKDTSSTYTARLYIADSIASEAERSPDALYSVVRKHQQRDNDDFQQDNNSDEQPRQQLEKWLEKAREETLITTGI